MNKINYNKHDWQNLELITEDLMDNMENGIAQATDKINEIIDEVSNNTNNNNTNSNNEDIVYIRNLFNKDTVTHNKSFNNDTSSFSVSNANGEVLTDFISVLPNTEYKSRCMGNRVYYDKNKTPIKKELYTAGKTIITPNNCYFIRYGFTRIHNGIDRVEIEMFMESTAFDLVGNSYLAYSDTSITMIKNDYNNYMKNKPHGFLELNDNGTINGEFVTRYYTKSEEIIDDANPLINYNGTVNVIAHETTDNSLNGTRHNLSGVGTFLTYDFIGTGIEAYDHAYENRGIVEIFIDGESCGTFDRYTSGTLRKTRFFKIDNLELKQHTIKIVLLEQVNPNHIDVKAGKTGDEIGRSFSFDYFVVINEKTSDFNNVNKYVTEKNKGSEISLWVGTQEEYDSITAKNDFTLYFIKGV